MAVTKEKIGISQIAWKFAKMLKSNVGVSVKLMPKRLKSTAVRLLAGMPATSIAPL